MTLGLKLYGESFKAIDKAVKRNGKAAQNKRMFNLKLSISKDESATYSKLMRYHLSIKLSNNATES